MVHGDGQVGRIDPATNTAGPPISVAPDKILSNMAFAGGYAWVSESSEGIVYKLDRTGVVGVIKVAPGIGTPAATSDTVWVPTTATGR